MREDYKKGGKAKKKDSRLTKAGVSGYNKPKRTPNHPKWRRVYSVKFEYIIYILKMCKNINGTHVINMCIYLFYKKIIIMIKVYYNNII